MITLEEMRDDCDWQAVFEFASGGSNHTDGNASGSSPSACVGDMVSCEPFNEHDVATIIGCSEGEQDESEWLIAGQLVDGRWFFIEAGCDYTGWD
jgi:hypothetical protein